MTELLPLEHTDSLLRGTTTSVENTLLSDHGGASYCLVSIPFMNRLNLRISTLRLFWISGLDFFVIESLLRSTLPLQVGTPGQALQRQTGVFH